MNANAPDNVSKETTTVAKEQRTADVMKGEQQQRGAKIVAELAEPRPETSSARESSASYTNNRSSSLMDISQMLNNGINNVPEASTKIPVAETPTDFFFNAEFDEKAVKCNMCVTKIFDHICTSCNSKLCSGCVGNHSCPCVNHSTLYMPEAIYYKDYAQKLYKKLCDVTKEKPKLTLNPENNATKNQYISNNPLNNSCESLSSSNEVSNSNSNISSSTVLSSVDDSAEVDRRLKVILEHTTNLIDICLESLREFQNEYNERLMSKYSHLTESSDEKSRELYRASNFIQKIVTNSVPSRLAADKDADSIPSSSQLNSKGAFLFLNSVEIINSYLKDSANVKAENIDIKKECQIFDIELCNLFKNKVQASLSPVNNSPISLFDKFKIPDKMSDMSVNEFTNVQFGHIYEPPGMSPKLNPFSLPLFSPGSTPDMYSLPHQTRGMISVMNNYSPHTAQIVDGMQFDSMGASQMNSFPNSMSKSPSLQMKKDMINSNNSRIIANSANQPNELDNMKQQSEQINSGRHSSRKTLMQIRRKFGELGPAVGQFNSPHGFCIDAHGNILIADTNNHRILFFTKEGELFNYFGNPGKADGQIWYPRKIAVYGKEQNVIVCDRGSERSRMQIFSQHGEFIRRIAIRYVDIVASIAVHESPSGVQIIIVDSVSPTVYVICESGDILSWFDCSDYMKEPSDLVVYGEYFLICDFKGHRVCVFQRDGTYVTFFGSESVTNFPNGIDVLDNGNILVGDSHGNRFHVVIYNHNWQQINEFECPFVKVSRCCGLKVTPDGCIITLAKNNHHVLILNQIPYTISPISQQQQNQNFEMQMMSKQPPHLRSKPFNDKMETLTLQD